MTIYFSIAFFIFTFLAFIAWGLLGASVFLPMPMQPNIRWQLLLAVVCLGLVFSLAKLPGSE
jgi:hypothetical protein